MPLARHSILCSSDSGFGGPVLLLRMAAVKNPKRRKAASYRRVGIGEGMRSVRRLGGAHLSGVMGD
jgi:hypothetical protein